MNIRTAGMGVRGRMRSGRRVCYYLGRNLTPKVTATGRQLPVTTF